LSSGEQFVVTVRKMLRDFFHDLALAHRLQGTAGDVLANDLLPIAMRYFRHFPIP
jgi:hypothetical protein